MVASANTLENFVEDGTEDEKVVYAITAINEIFAGLEEEPRKWLTAYIFSRWG